MSRFIIVNLKFFPDSAKFLKDVAIVCSIVIKVKNVFFEPNQNRNAQIKSE